MQYDLSESLDADQSGKKANVSAWTIRNLIRQGKLPAFKIGGEYRVLPEDLDTYLASTRTIKQ